MALRTKNAIRRSFVELLAERPFDKISVRRGRYDVSQSCFAAARRSPKNTAAQPIELNGPPQEAALRHDMLLPDEFVEVIGTHLIRKRFRVVLVIV